MISSRLWKVVANFNFLLKCFRVKVKTLPPGRKNKTIARWQFGWTQLDHSLADPPFRWSFLRAQWANEAAFGGKIVPLDARESIYTFDYLEWKRRRVSWRDEKYLLLYYLHLIKVTVTVKGWGWSRNNPRRWWRNSEIGGIVASRSNSKPCSSSKIVI